MPPGFTYQVTPPGKRPFYCVTRFTYSHGGPLLPLDYDVCSTKTTKLEEELALSGDGYVPYKIGNTEYLAVITPVYPGGVVPPTLQARTDSAIGVVGLIITPNFVLRQALKEQPGTAIAFHFRIGDSTTTFKASSAPAGAESFTTNLNNAWSIQVFGADAGDGIAGNGNAQTLFLGEMLVSELLATLVYLLGTRRSRR